MNCGEQCSALHALCLLNVFSSVSKDIFLQLLSHVMLLHLFVRCLFFFNFLVMLFVLSHTCPVKATVSNYCAAIRLSLYAGSDCSRRRLADLALSLFVLLSP